MAAEDGRHRRWGYALAVATAAGLFALFFPWIVCPSCAGEGKHVWNQKDYPCLVCDGARRVSGRAWMRAMTR